MKIIFSFLYFILAFNVFAEQKPEYQFVPNKNQWESDIRYRLGIPSGYLYLKNQSLQYLFVDLQKLSDIKHGRIQDSKARQEEGIAAHSVLINFLESNPNPVILEENPNQDLQNFFLGNDPNFWASNVQSFGKIIYQEMYEGIDFMFSSQKNNLKYEFKLQKQADPAKIRMKYEGASEMRLLENGNLLVKTTLGTWIPAEFTLENNVLGFHFPKSYNKNYELIIDPELVFSTFSGSTIDNWGNTATYDEEGNLYSGGSFFNPNFPQSLVLQGKVGTFNITASGISDVCVLKFSPKGQLIFASYFGGSGTEVAHSMFVNNAKQILIMGSTGSANFPTSNIAFDRSFNGGKFDGNDILEGMKYEQGVDIFVCALRTDGSSLDASTYIGGADNDGVGQINNPLVKNYGDQFRGEIICDKDNNVYIASTTRSKDFPTTRSAWQKTLKGTQDAIIFKMTPNLSDLVWSTYFGGTQNEMAYSLKLNAEGEIFVAGGTDSRDLDTQPNAVNRFYGGNIDGFLAKFQNNGSWSGGTYLGTTAYDQAYFVDIDAEGNVYIFGNTAGNYVIQNVVYRNANGGQFLHKLNPLLNQTIFSTRLGSGRGVPDISPTAFLVSDCGQIYMAGWGGVINNFSPHYIGSQIGRSSTLGLPVTSDALKSVTNGDDFYLMVLEKNATSLRYGSFFGGTVTDVGSGNHVDGGTSRFDKKGVIYHAVCACRANNIPTTAGAWSAVNRATNECNIASFKIGILSLKAKFVPRDEKNNIVRSGCVPLKLRFENQSIN
ncbi:MAG: PKD domain-containing protein, partial [Bacteroidetes bacterium]